ENIPVDQSVAMTGSLSVRGDVLPVGGVTAKIEAAAAAGITSVIIPSENLKDVMLEKKIRNTVKIVPAKNLSQVLEHALAWGEDKESLLEKIKDLIPLPKGIEKPLPKKHVVKS
ncbi:MAG: ATP-dependent protease LonB, partial [Candidatus Hydrothermarchaeota archaeon]|nr:ATP-dependent protease LonB [Candidatus Hydrothermarchaeota archaeon]